VLGKLGNNSREAAEECSPGREPWVISASEASPEGAKEKLRHKQRRHSSRWAQHCRARNTLRNLDFSRAQANSSEPARTPVHSPRKCCPL